jgi:hypothetical protein
MTRRDSAFAALGEHPTQPSHTWFALFTCDSCGYAVIGQIVFDSKKKLTELNKNGRYPSGPESDILSHLATDEFDSSLPDIKWQPQSALGKEYLDVNNDTIKDSASEAHSCYSIRAYRAAILMARSVVEAIAKDKGITDGNLKKKIAALEEQQLISPLVREQADEIRYFGNDMAHGDFALPVDAADAREVLDFLDVFIDAIYQQPAKLLAMKQSRELRRQSETNG